MRSLLPLAIVILAALAACSTAPAGDDAASLAGTSWSVRAVDGTSVLAGSELTTVFADDGRLSGNAGCNQYFAKWTVNADGGLAVTDSGASKRLCHQPEGVMQQEARFLEVLASVTVAERTGTELSLTTADGRSLELQLTP